MSDVTGEPFDESPLAVIRRELDVIRHALEVQQRILTTRRMPATVDAYREDERVADVIIDGDDDATDASNLTGMSLSEGQRVLVEFDIDGAVYVRGLIDEGEAVEYDVELFNVTIGDGETFGRWSRVNGRVFFDAGFVLGSTSSVTGTIGVGLPADAHVDHVEQNIVVPARAVDSGVQTIGGQGAIIDGEEDRVGRFNGSTGPWNATSPHTWGAGDSLWVSGSYEPAE